MCPPRPATVCNVCCLNGGFRNPPSTKTQYTCSKLYSAKCTFIVNSSCTPKYSDADSVESERDTSHLHTAPGLLLCEGGSVHYSSRPRPDDGCNSYYESGPRPLPCIWTQLRAHQHPPNIYFVNNRVVTEQLHKEASKVQGARNSHAIRNQA